MLSALTARFPMIVRSSEYTSRWSRLKSLMRRMPLDLK